MRTGASHHSPVASRWIISLLLVGLGACGGDDGGESGDGDDLPPSAVHIALIDNEYDPSDVSVPSGATVSIHLQNSGDNPHTFTSDDLSVDVTVQPGQTEVVEIEGPEAETEFICNFHGSSGMTGTVSPE